LGSGGFSHAVHNPKQEKLFARICKLSAKYSRMIRKRILLICFISVFHCCQALAEVNLALRKSYTVSPKPNYQHCTDSMDRIQLTDGKALGSNWLNKSTVGWHVRASIPEVTIDLERTAIIEQVRVCTRGGGAAQVFWPDFVIVLVSKDGRSFKCAGIAGGRDPGGKAKYHGRGIPYTIVAKNLAAQGRFVKLILQPGGALVFLDEVEVIGSFSSAIGNLALRTNLPSFKDPVEPFDLAESQVQLRDNLDKTITFVATQQKRLTSIRDELDKNLEDLDNRLSRTTDRLFLGKEQAEFSKELGLLRAKIYQEVYTETYVCIPANPMEPLAESSMIFETEAAREINVSLWKGEFESAALNIINCSEQPMTLSVGVSPLKATNAPSLDSREVFTIRRGIFVKARRIGSIADALIIQNSRPFSLMPGEATQIWLTIHSRGLAAGEYKAGLAVLASLADGKDLADRVIPLNIRVEPINLPKDIPFNSCNWAYPKLSGITNKYLAETARDLSSHYTNVFVVHNKNIPFPTRLSPRGDIMAMVPYEETDELLRINSYARTFLFFLAFRAQRRDSGKFGKWMSDEWKKTFSTWLIDWVEHLKHIGVGYDRFAMYPFDESLCDEFYELAMLIKKIDPKIRIFANHFRNGPRDFMRFKELVDIWCPREVYCAAHPDWVAKLKDFGKPVWTYDCKGPGKANNPYGYYRLMPWKAFKYGFTGSGFWIHSEPIETAPWDDTALSRGYYGVVYGATESPVDILGEIIVPSRRWEAWREGIEDYVYLWQLQTAIDEIKTTEPAKANQLQQLIRNVTEKVLQNPDDYNGAYEARKNISRALIQLKNGNFN